ncbi:MAG: small subunit ribosomal protein S8 [Puniceicoccaceae bacterium 5H]|nr:MAG: small subunit ribosomal protein S8 [Puniceicoccaceae bacterium 5H]
MSDTISDFLTIIRNAYRSGKDTCSGRYSKMHLAIAQILKDEGYIRDFAEGADDNGHKALVLTLKYVDDQPALTGIRRVSTPGRRMYFQSRDIPRTLGGLGLGILTTSKGVLKDRDARRQNIGGEMICSVW